MEQSFYKLSYARDGWNLNIIDNTNVKKWEMDVFVETAIQYGYLMKIVEPWSNSAGE